MAIVLSHKSALEYWRSVRIGDHRYSVVSHARNLIASFPALEFDDSHGPWWIERPLHVLVSEASLRRSSKSITSHVWSGLLPKGSVLDTGNGYYVSSPELCFIQMADSMGLIELIGLGFELCGTYDVSNGGILECASLTTVSRLKMFVSKMSKAYGSRKATKALNYVVENSASPMESALAMLLSLPYRLGGYGIDKPILNYRIDFEKSGCELKPRKYVVCDLYWPQARLAAEYDSNQFHVGEEKHAKDSIRRAELASLGITVVSVTRRQIASRAEMDKLANLLAKYLGKRVRFTEPRFSRSCSSLRGALLGVDIS